MSQLKLMFTMLNTLPLPCFPGSKIIPTNDTKGNNTARAVSKLMFSCMSVSNLVF